MSYKDYGFVSLENSCRDSKIHHYTTRHCIINSKRDVETTLDAARENGAINFQYRSAGAFTECHLELRDNSSLDKADKQQRAEQGLSTRATTGKTVLGLLKRASQHLSLCSDTLRSDLHLALKGSTLPFNSNTTQQEETKTHSLSCRDDKAEVISCMTQVDAYCKEIRPA